MIRLVVFEKKRKKHWTTYDALHSEKMASPSRRLGYSNNLRLVDVIFRNWECVGVERLLRFSRKRQDGSEPNFFRV